MTSHGGEIDGIIFDMDGVLCDSESFICEAAVRLFEVKYGITVKPADFIPFVGTGENRYLGGVAEKYGVTLDLRADKQFTYDTYLDLIRGRLRPLAGVESFTAAARRSGMKLAVASSADKVKVEGNLREIGMLSATFDAIVDGLEVENKKPAPDIFQLAARRIGLDCEACLVVEDAPNGLQAGKSAGCRCLGITSSFSHGVLAGAGADWICANLAEVPDELRRLLFGAGAGTAT
ncbi:MAG: HAD-IA family hydrolase [bacterium]